MPKKKRKKLTLRVIHISRRQLEVLEREHDLHTIMLQRERYKQHTECQKLEEKRNPKEYIV